MRAEHMAIPMRLRSLFRVKRGISCSSLLRLRLATASAPRNDRRAVVLAMAIGACCRLTLTRVFVTTRPFPFTSFQGQGDKGASLRAEHMTIPMRLLPLLSQGQACFGPRNYNSLCHSGLFWLSLRDPSLTHSG